MPNVIFERPFVAASTMRNAGFLSVRIFPGGFTQFGSCNVERVMAQDPRPGDVVPRSTPVVLQTWRRFCL